MTTKEFVTKQLEKNKSFLFSQFGIVQIGIFGSVSAGTDSVESDIDLLYVLDDHQKLGFLQYDELEDYIKSILNHRKIDLVDKTRLNPVFQAQILGSVQYV
jgi:predicted nucleotidyltransferase